MNKNRKKWLDTLNRRVLIREKLGIRLVVEAKVKEVSERFVKLHFIESGANRWCDFDDYNICEVLPMTVESVPIAEDETKKIDCYKKYMERMQKEGLIINRPYPYKGDIVETTPMDNPKFT
jgi:hypothetical protein